MSESKIRVWLTSLLGGAALSVIITAGALKAGVAYWFPPCWPGLLLWFVCAALGHREVWNSDYALAVMGVGNAVFYAWLSVQILRAEILARGRLSRHFLR
jgi:hypothetical protein